MWLPLMIPSFVNIAVFLNHLSVLSCDSVQDMEKWAKSLNAQKEAQREVKKSVAQSGGAGVSKHESATADAGFAILQKVVSICMQPACFLYVHGCCWSVLKHPAVLFDLNIITCLCAYAAAELAGQKKQGVLKTH